VSKKEGILLVNKDSGWTSHDVCQLVKRRFRIPKVGHTGTLDPQATGVLVLLLGKFTKYSAQFVGCDKTYRGTIELGITTSSQDGDGKILERKEWEHIRPDEVHTVINGFHGPQDQIPPMVSAVRTNGKRLYALARKGITVEREPREITVHSISCDKIELPFIDFTVHSSKGTYIRTLAHDIGQKLGTGAYLKRLCRIQVGDYHIDDCVAVETLKGLKEPEELVNFMTTKFPSFITAKDS